MDERGVSVRRGINGAIRAGAEPRRAGAFATRTHPMGCTRRRPGPHPVAVAALLAEVGVGGNLVTDAHLAALALEQRAEVVSFDNDFARFSALRWRRPVDLLS